MKVDEPLPLLKPANLNDTKNEGTDGNASFKKYGYLLLIFCWFVFLLTTNTIFELWKYVIYPLSQYDLTQDIYKRLFGVLLTVDYYVLSLWSYYIVIWAWSFISWVGLKFFRHSKGTEVEQ